ncbi:MAG: hypothetical protein Q9218_006973, partial [Villophora microphyllina]
MKFSLFPRAWNFAAVFWILSLRSHESHCQSVNSTEDAASTANISTPYLTAEWVRYAVEFQQIRTDPNQFTIEQVALTAIGAMKEEALLPYSAIVLQYESVDDFHPENPVYITLDYRPGGPELKATRGAVLWSLKTLSVQMMRLRYFYTLLFMVTHSRNVVWMGRVLDRYQGTTSYNSTIANGLSAGSTGAPPSLVSVPRNATTIELKRSTPLKDDPHYEIDFQFPGSPIAKIGTFEAIMELLLVLGKLDAAEERVRDSMVYGRLQVWIFLVEVLPPVEEHRFQQFQEVAILEAIARYYVQTDVYKELTFIFK